MGAFDVGPSSFGAGFGTGMGSGALTTGVAAPTSTTPNPPMWSPENPLFWFGALLLAAAGFVWVQTSVRAGPLKGEASI